MNLQQRVVAFVAAQCGADEDKLRPQTTLFGGLGVDGDDGCQLVEEFARQFSVDLSGFDPTEHFGPEGMAVLWPFYWLVIAFRSGTPEQRAGLKPITLADLIRSAESRRWVQSVSTSASPS